MSPRRFLPRPPRLVPRLLPRAPFRQRRRRFDAAPIVLALLAFGGVSAWMSTGKPPESTSATQVAAASFEGEQRVVFSICGRDRHTCIVDGDTIWLNGQNLRLESYDTPEPYDDICGGAAEIALAKRATARLLQLLNNNSFNVYPTGSDRYGRTLATISIDGRDVGEILISEGLARSWPNGEEFWC